MESIGKRMGGRGSGLMTLFGKLVLTEARVEISMLVAGMVCLCHPRQEIERVNWLRKVVDPHLPSGNDSYGFGGLGMEFEGGRMESGLEDSGCG